jgi:hypothetical protein
MALFGDNQKEEEEEKNVREADTSNEDNTTNSFQNPRSKQENNQNETKEEGVSLEEMDMETADIENRATRGVWFRLMMPYEVSRYVTTALWTFVVVGFLLNFAGYAWVWDGHQLTIDTLAQRQFQQEINRAAKSSVNQ